MCEVLTAGTGYASFQIPQRKVRHEFDFSNSVTSFWSHQNLIVALSPEPFYVVCSEMFSWDHMFTVGE